jgi:hypothetical protein
VARGEEGVEVGNGAARRQNTIAPVLPADNLTHAFHHHRLHQNEHGRDLVSEHVGVGRCRQPLARHRHQVQPARQLVEEMRMTCVKWKKFIISLQKFKKFSMVGKLFLHFNQNANFHYELETLCF